MHRLPPAPAAAAVPDIVTPHIRSRSHITAHRYSIAVLIVEVIGVSALVPYAFANLKPTLPIEEPEKDAPTTWKEFGVSDK